MKGKPLAEARAQQAWHEEQLAAMDAAVRPQTLYQGAAFQAAAQLASAAASSSSGTGTGPDTRTCIECGWWGELGTCDYCWSPVCTWHGRWLTTGRDVGTSDDRCASLVFALQASIATVRTAVSTGHLIQFSIVVVCTGVLASCFSSSGHP